MMYETVSWLSAGVCESESVVRVQAVPQTSFMLFLYSYTCKWSRGPEITELLIGLFNMSRASLRTNKRLWVVWNWLSRGGTLLIKPLLMPTFAGIWTHAGRTLYKHGSSRWEGCVHTTMIYGAYLWPCSFSLKSVQARPLRLCPNSPNNSWNGC